jgi:hypothetical protein
MPYPCREEEGRLRHPVRFWGDVGRPSNERVRRPWIANNYYCMFIVINSIISRGVSADNRKSVG